MRRFYLFTLLATLFALNIMAAQQVGDYVYTDDARLKVTGGNVITNGDFSQGTTGWTTDGGTTLSPDTFAVVNDGPDGSYCLQVLHRSKAFLGGTIKMNWTLEAGQTYVFSYKVKSIATDVTAIAQGDANYQDLYLCAAGSSDKTGDYTQVAKSVSYGSEWTTVSYCVTATEEQTNLVLYMSQLAIEDEFADFSLCQVQKVGDDRAVNSKLNEIRATLANSYWQDASEESKATMNEVIESVLAMVDANELDDYLTVESMLTEIDVMIEDFYKTNSTDVTSYFTNGDLSTIKNKSNTIEGWETTGDRWNNVNSGDNLYAQRQYPQGYYLSEGYCRQFQDLPKGKYMFTMDVEAQMMKKGIDPTTGKTSKTIVDNSKTFTGIKIFINGDSTLCEPIKNDAFTTYTVYSTVAEDSALTVGIYIPGETGQVVKFKNSKIRFIGQDSENALNEYYNAKELRQAKYALKVMIDRVEEYYADNDNYLYGKQELRDSLDAAISVYNTVDIPDTLTNCMNRLRNARKEYVRQNAEYTQFVTDIAEADSIATLDIYPDGREAFQKAIASATSFRGSLDAQSRDSVGLVSASNTLVEAQNAFLVGNARYDNPVKLRLLVNPQFTNDMTGWTYSSTNATIASGTKSDYTGYEKNVAAYYWRGTSIAKTPPTFSIYQDIDIPYAGVYDISAKIVAWNESTKYDTEETGVYFYIGSGDVRNDSLLVHASTPTAFALRHNYESGQTLRIGVDGMGNTCCNVFMFGDVVTTYYGTYDQYIAGIEDVKTVNPIANGKVYTLSGTMVRQNADNLSSLPKGIYIVNGKKIVIR